jgi:hypothetical protein
MTAPLRPSDAPVKAGRNASRWRLAIVPCGFVCAVAIFLVCDNLTLRGQLLLGPDAVFFCTPTHVAAVILFLVVAALSVPAGFLVANLLLWPVPAIRAALQRSGARRSFAAANAEFVQMTAILALVLLPVYAVAVGSKVCLSESQLYYQPSALWTSRSYDLSQVTDVRPRCARSSRGGWNLGLDVTTADGSSFDLAVVDPWFASSSDRILAVLRGIESNDSGIEPGCPTALRALVVP